MTPVADVHNHAIPAGFVERVRAEGAGHGFTYEGEPGGKQTIVVPDGRRVNVRPEHIDEDLRQKELADAGIDLILESATPGLMSYGSGEADAVWGAQAVNDGLAENMAAYPDRISAMAIVPLQFPALAVDELERVVRVHGMRCVEIGSNVKGENLDDPGSIPSGRRRSAWACWCSSTRRTRPPRSGWRVTTSATWSGTPWRTRWPWPACCSAG
jgi:aminocarboxymuconate-semialdehyde decarboxylase